MLLLCSIAGSETTIKAIRALLAGALACTFRMQARSARKRRTLAEPAGHTAYLPGSLYRHTKGYDCEVTRLGYDTWHLVAIAADPCLMPVFSRTAFERALRSPRFTTPFLPEWLDFLADRLLSEGHLHLCDGFQAFSGWLSCTTAEIDAAVSTGLQRGVLAIPPPPAEVA